MSMFIIERKKNFFNMLAYVHQRRTNVIIISQQGLIQRITRVNKFAYKFSAACEASSPANTQVFRCFFLSPFFYMVGKLYLFPSPQLFCFDFFVVFFVCIANIFVQILHKMCRFFVYTVEWMHMLCDTTHLVCHSHVLFHMQNDPQAIRDINSKRLTPKNNGQKSQRMDYI